MTKPIIKPILAVDFDGVIHSYELGWNNGAIYGSPVEGAMQALVELSRDYKLIVLTARPETQFGRIKAWIETHQKAGPFAFEVTNVKPPAAAYIDDRAIRFRDWPQALSELGK